MYFCTIKIDTTRKKSLSSWYEIKEGSTKQQLNTFQMKKLLLIAAMAVMTIGAWAQSASDYGIIMEQPAGELKVYDRSGYAYYESGEYPRRGTQTGTISIVFGEDNKVYFKQPLSKLEVGSWVEGTLSEDGKTITLPMGQNVAYNADQGEVITLAVLDYDDDYEEFEVRNSAHNVQFSVTDEKISLIGTNAYVVLGAIFADSKGWAGYADYSSVYTPTTQDEDVLVELPAGVTPQVYKFTANGYDGTPFSYNVNVGVDNNDVYIQGIFGDVPNSWIKGTRNGNNVTFAKDQFIGNVAGKPNYMAGGQTNAEGKKDICDFVLAYDEETDTYTNVTDYLVQNTTKGVIYYVQAFNNIVITKDVNDGAYTVPYNEMFETQNAFAEYTVINANNDSRTWTYGGSISQNVTYQWDTNNAADDWLITPAIIMEAGNKYEFGVDAKASMYAERFEVKMGTEPTVEAMTNTVIPAVEINGSEIASYTGQFNINTDGKYYFGIHAISDANQFTLSVDNVRVILCGPTAIEEINVVKNTDDNYYDLMGRKMNSNNLPAGIYIHGGKKVLIK